MGNYAKTIINYVLFFVMTFFAQNCAAEKIKEIGRSSLSIESPQKLIEEIKSTGVNLLMNTDSYDILVKELENYNGEGIVINSLDGITLDANKAYLKMLGYTSEKIKSITYQELTPAKWHTMEHDLFEKVMKTGYSGVYKKEYIRKDGTIFPIHYRVLV